MPHTGSTRVLLRTVAILVGLLDSTCGRSSTTAIFRRTSSRTWRLPPKTGEEKGRHHPMMRSLRRKSWTLTTVLAIACAGIITYALRLHAADHGDAPLVAHDQAADIGDVYFFLDPNDNSQVI